MSAETTKLAKRMRDELNHLERALQRAQMACQRAQLSSDDLYLDSAALNLHGFYSGLESLFEAIATTIDGHLPTGDRWHQALLQQMVSELPAVRPAVLTEASQTGLEAYRSFRHVVRNIYTFNFDPERLKKLVDAAPPLFKQLRLELLAFADFLEQQA